MQVHRENITVPQGTTYRQKLYYVFPNGDPIPLHDFTACMQIREYVEAPEVLYKSEYGSDIVIEAEAGAIYLRIPSSKTERWDWLRGVYDIELTSPHGQTTRIMEGRVRVTPNVTRACSAVGSGAAMRANSGLTRIEIHATITRADGSMESLGPIACYHQSRWRRWCWRLRQRLKGVIHG